MVKQSKKAPGATRRHVKAGDYSGVVCSILKEAQVLYRCAISTVDAFLSVNKKLDLAYNAWADACVMHGKQIEADDDLIKLVCYEFLRVLHPI